MRKKKNLHVIFFAAVLIIIIILVAQILIWNLGIDGNYDPNDVLEGFDTEVNDIIMYNSADKPDDGINHVLLLGNSPVYDGEQEKQLSDYIAANTKAIVDSVSFPDALAASYTDINEDPVGIDAFSFYRLCYALAESDFYNQDINIDTVVKSYGSEYRSMLDTMKSIDMSTVDTIVVYYDVADYYAGLGLYNPDNESDIKCFRGALYAGIKRIQQVYPDINFVISSLQYALYVDEDGTLIDGASMDFGNGAIYNYFDVQLQAAVSCGASFVDNYYGSVTADNYEQYLEDHVHLNDAGRKLIAERISSIVKVLR